MIYHFKNPHSNKEHNKGWVRWSIRSKEPLAIHLLLMQGLTRPWSCCPVGRSFVLKLWDYTQMHAHTLNTTHTQHTHICIFPWSAYTGLIFVYEDEPISYRAKDGYRMFHTWTYLQVMKCQAKCPSNLSNFVLTSSFGKSMLYAE